MNADDAFKMAIDAEIRGMYADKAIELERLIYIYRNRGEIDFAERYQDELEHLRKHFGIPREQLSSNRD